MTGPPICRIKTLNYCSRSPHPVSGFGPYPGLSAQAILRMEDPVNQRSRYLVIPAALLALFLAAGCVSAPKEAETVQTEAEADAGSSASTDADSGASASN